MFLIRTTFCMLGFFCSAIFIKIPRHFKVHLPSAQWYTCFSTVQHWCWDTVGRNGDNTCTRNNCNGTVFHRQELQALLGRGNLVQKSTILQWKYITTALYENLAVISCKMSSTTLHTVAHSVLLLIWWRSQEKPGEVRRARRIQVVKWWDGEVANTTVGSGGTSGIR